MNTRAADVIRGLRNSIPAVNLATYDAESASMLEALRIAPERFDELTAWFWCRVQDLRARDLSAAPPCLVPRNAETTMQWLDRCYAAGGYTGGITL